jgi:hypothetical protein
MTTREANAAEPIAIRADDHEVKRLVFIVTLSDMEASVPSLTRRESLLFGGRILLREKSDLFAGLATGSPFSKEIGLLLAAVLYQMWRSTFS